MDTTSGKKQVEFKEMMVECPKYKGLCLSITVEACKACPHHNGFEKITELRGVEIFDIICKLPTRKRVTRLVCEVTNACTE